MIPGPGNIFIFTLAAEAAQMGHAEVNPRRLPSVIPRRSYLHSATLPLHPPRAKPIQ